MTPPGVRKIQKSDHRGDNAVTQVAEVVPQYGPRHAAEGLFTDGEPPRLRRVPRHAAPDTTDATDVIPAVTSLGEAGTGIGSGRTDASRSQHDREVALFASEVRRAIAVSGYSLRQLESMLDTYGPDFRSAIGTLSAWQSGTTAPTNTESGLSRVLAFERCLGVPAGDLATLIPGSDVPPTPTRSLTQIGVHNRPARATLTERHKQFQDIVNRLSGPQRTIPISTTKTYVLGWGNRPVHTVISPRLRAANDLVDRHWFLHAPTTHAHPVVTEISGCQRGRTINEDQVLRSNTSTADGGYQLQAVELLFDRVLRRGEPYEFSFTVGYAGDDTRPDDLFRHVQSQPCEALNLLLEFREDKPAELYQCRWNTQDFQLTEQRPLDVRSCASYQQVIDNPLPGAYGWSWTSAPAS
jgi:hypothetical protein